MTNWGKVTRKELDTISKIVDRAQGMYSFLASGDRLGAMMDMQACHTSHPLDLAKFLAFDDGNFGHDFCGIIRHLDRNTGELTECFSPRCSK